jgi:ribokinase
VAGRVIVVGDLAVDYFLRLPPGAGADEKITAEQSVRLPGGTGGNAAVAARVLGSEVRLHSAVGDDPAGQWLAAAAAARGVDPGGIQVFPGASTQATILLSGPDRRVIVDRGVADQLGRLDPPVTSAADVVYLTGHGPAIAQMASASLAGYLIAGLEHGMAGTPGLAAALRRVHLIITNTAGRAAFAGQLPPGPVLVETRGADGAVIHDPAGLPVPVPAIPVRVADATGAGDCFAGALSHYLRTGLELTAAVRLATVAAALSTRALGAQRALPADAGVRAAAGLPILSARSEA